MSFEELRLHEQVPRSDIIRNQLYFTYKLLFDMVSEGCSKAMTASDDSAR